MSNKNPSPMTRRDFLRLAGISAVSVVAAACGGGGTTTTTAPAAPTTAPAGKAAAPTAAAPAVAKSAPAGSKEGSIRIAQFGSRATADLRAKLIPGFNKKFPNVKVEYIPIQATDWEDFFGKVLTMKAAGDTPDLIGVATEGTQLFAGKDLAIPLDDYVMRDKADLTEFFKDVHPALMESYMYEGRLYELPSNWNAPNMYINVNVMKEAGLSYPKADWTKDDFYEFAKKMTKQSGGQTTTFGYGWTNRLWGSWGPWIFTNNSNLLTESKAPGGEWFWNTFYKDDPAAKGRGGGWRWDAPQANAAPNVEALEFVRALAKEGISPALELGGGQTLQGIFSANNLGMTPAGGFWAGGLKNAGMAKGTFDVQFWPKWKSQRHQFGTAGYVITKEAKDKDLCWEYCKYLTTVEAQMIDMEGNTTTPPRRSFMTAERYKDTGPEHWQVFYDTLDKNPDTAPIPAPPESNPMTQIFTKYTGLAMNGEQAPKAALDNMQKELEALFAKRKK